MATWMPVLIAASPLVSTGCATTPMARESARVKKGMVVSAVIAAPPGMQPSVAMTAPATLNVFYPKVLKFLIATA